MLKYTPSAILGMIGLFMLALVPKTEARPVDMVSFQLFYDQLAPYGVWVDDPEYGYIWLPDAGPNFMPYSSNGYWVMTKYGNTWVSNYEWGWAPFHYGRWFHTDYYGWAWVPDYEWGPAWVSWRSGGGYYGWAPLGPRVSLAVTVRIPSFHWVFVPNRYFTSPHVHRYYVSHRNHVRIYNRTTIINNYYVVNNKKYVSGPARRDIERSTGSRVSVRTINNSNNPNRVAVNARSVSIYRPSIDESTRTAARPARVTDAVTARSRVAERVSTTARSRVADEATARNRGVERVATNREGGRTAAARGEATRGEATRATTRSRQVQGREAATRAAAREVTREATRSRQVQGREVTREANRATTRSRQVQGREAAPRTATRETAREVTRSEATRSTTRSTSSSRTTGN